MVCPEEKSRVLTYGVSPYTMYYLKHRVDALTTFIPALVEEVVYALECLKEYLMKGPSEELVRRLTVSSFSNASDKIKRNSDEKDLMTSVGKDTVFELDEEHESSVSGSSVGTDSEFNSPDRTTAKNEKSLLSPPPQFN